LDSRQKTYLDLRWMSRGFRRRATARIAPEVGIDSGTENDLRPVNGRAPGGIAAAVLVAVVGLWSLSAGLPAGAFFSGDPGLKLIAAMNAIAHPTRPFDIDLPRIGDKTVPWVDPMILVHEQHGHALQSPLFPVLSAPLIAVFGLRGAYVLPGLGFLLLLVFVDAMRRSLAPGTSFLILASIAIGANPLLFYSLEYWEHSLAIALLAGSTAAAVTADGDTPRAGRLVISGALAGLSVLLRPEAIWYVAALAIYVSPRYWIAFGSGVALIIVPFSAANVIHFGNPAGPHATVNLAPLKVDFLSARRERIDTWLSPQAFLAAAGLLLMALAWLTRAVMELRARQVAALLGTAAVATAAALRMVSRESIWQAFPLVLLALLPVTGSSDRLRRLYLLALVSVCGVILTATHDGGAQWGPRFLLVSVPPLIVLGACGATDAVGEGRWRALRIALVGLILVAGVATSRAAYRELRGAKRSYERAVLATAEMAPPGTHIVTNVWYLDQIAATLHDSRFFVYVPDRDSAARALDELSRADVRHVLLVSSLGDSSDSLDPVALDSCFKPVGVRDVTEHRLHMVSAECR
jgi:hypothetical protein